MNVSPCRNGLTPLQRRTIQKMCGVGVLAMLSNFSSPNAVNPLVDTFPSLARLAAHPSPLAVTLVSAICILPVIVAVWVAGAYLKAEPDEFIRNLAVKALLWGFAVTMACDALVGALSNFYARPLPLGLLNADVFLLSTAIAFRLVLRDYR